jgi:hypothetical protein
MKTIPLLPEWLPVKDAARTLGYRTTDPVVSLIEEDWVRSCRDARDGLLVHSRDVAQILAGVSDEHPWVSRDKARAILGVSIRSIDRAISSGHLRYRQAHRSAPTGGPTPRLLDGVEVAQLAMLRKLHPKLTTTQINRYLSVTRNQG